MGIYDRDYHRQPSSGFNLGGERSMVINILIFTIGVYIVDLILNNNSDPSGYSGVSKYFALFPEGFHKNNSLLTHPWRIIQLLSYGFLHAKDNIQHIIFNMFVFWMFGRGVEQLYGRQKFLGFYLTAIVVSGAIWLISVFVAGNISSIPLVGASGGVVAIVILLVLHNPHQEIYLFGIVPLPMWALGALYILGDIFGAMNPSADDNVAYIAHLGGALYGVFYYQTRWSFDKLVPNSFSLKNFKRGPKLKIHKPEEKEQALDKQVDEILRKIESQGEESLTSKERKILEKASRRYQQKRR